jgi:hypothetical protein
MAVRLLVHVAVDARSTSHRLAGTLHTVLNAFHHECLPHSIIQYTQPHSCFGFTACPYASPPAAPFAALCDPLQARRLGNEAGTSTTVADALPDVLQLHFECSGSERVDPSWVGHLYRPDVTAVKDQRVG